MQSQNLRLKHFHFDVICENEIEEEQKKSSAQGVSRVASKAHGKTTGSSSFARSSSSESVSSPTKFGRKEEIKF
jgi:hypothetical protein